MAGIKLIERLLKEGKTNGKVIALGRTIDKDNYVIIKWDGDKGFSTIFDYGSDVHIAENVRVSSLVCVKKISEYDGLVSVDVQSFFDPRDFNIYLNLSQLRQYSFL